jgi:hypothetical protein
VSDSRARRASAAVAGLAAGSLLLAVAACGGSGAQPGTSAERQFAANAAGLIGQLHDDLAVSEAEASSLASARRTLQNSSDLLATFVAFIDFGSCGQMVKNAGTPTGRLRRVQATLRSACRLLERASPLFTTAEVHSDARALLAATRIIVQASPLLYRAQVELDAASPHR